MSWILAGVLVAMASEFALHRFAPRLAAALAWMRVGALPLERVVAALPSTYRTAAKTATPVPEGWLAALAESGADVGQWRGRVGYLRVGGRLPMVCRLEVDDRALHAFIAPYPLTPLLLAAVVARGLPPALVALPFVAALGLAVVSLRHCRAAAASRLDDVGRALSDALREPMG